MRVSLQECVSLPPDQRERERDAARDHLARPGPGDDDPGRVCARREGAQRGGGALVAARQ
jgi:hypothetical protein